MTTTIRAVVNDARRKEAAELARRHVSEAIRQAGVVALVQPALGRISFGKSVYGSVSINVGATWNGEIATVWIDRDPHPTEGSRRTRIMLADPFDAEGRPRPPASRKLEAFVTRIGDLQKRDARIAASGGDMFSPGPRHFRIHALVKRLIEYAGVSVDEICEIDRYPQGSQGVIELPNGLQIRRIWKGTPDDEKRTVTTIRAEARGSRIVVPEAVFDSGCPHPIEIKETAARLEVQICRMTVPDTLLTTLRGKDVSEVVSHPAFLGTGIRIVSARAEARGVVLNLASMVVPLSPVEQP